MRISPPPLAFILLQKKWGLKIPTRPPTSRQRFGVGALEIGGRVRWVGINGEKEPDSGVGRKGTLVLNNIPRYIYIHTQPID